MATLKEMLAHGMNVSWCFFLGGSSSSASPSLSCLSNPALSPLSFPQMARFDFSFTDTVSIIQGAVLPWQACTQSSRVSAPLQNGAHPDPLALISQEMHQKGLDNLRAASKETRTLCATWMDTLGPEIIVVNRCVV